MNDSDYDLLSRVVVSGHTGDAELATTHLGHPDPAVRAAALAAMDRLELATAAMVGSALVDPDSSVRRRATAVAAGRPELTDALLVALDDDDHMVAEAAAFALGELPEAAPAGHAAVVEALSSMATDHQDALCRESAVAALGSLGAAAGLAAVLTACGDKATVRRRAVLALAAFEGEQVTAMLQSLSEDRDLQVRQAAEDLLAIEHGRNI